MRHKVFEEYLKTRTYSEEVLIEFSGESLADDGSPSVYPWGLEYRIRYLLSSKKLRVSFEVRRKRDGLNSGALVNFAFHPYFYTEANKNSHGSAYLGKDENQWIEFSDKAYSMDCSPISIYTSGAKICMNTWGFEHIYIWSDDRSRYICVETVFQLPKYFWMKQGIFLHPRESISAIMELTVV